jgi:hypothetical protein
VGSGYYHARAPVVRIIICWIGGAVSESYQYKDSMLLLNRYRLQKAFILSLLPINRELLIGRKQQSIPFYCRVKKWLKGYLLAVATHG